MKKLVLLRHGESEWNLDNRFTGWTDVNLTKKGIEEAKHAGKLLKNQKISFDLVFTSVLKRAVDTMNICLNQMKINNISKQFEWRLNERHYGSLQGLNKLDTAEKYGDKKVHIWRRSYNVPPPPLQKEDERHPCNDDLYKNLDPNQLPSSESLKDTINRLMPLVKNKIEPELQNGREILIVAHGNTLRGLIKYLDNISDAEIMEKNIPTGIPLVYELNKLLKPIKSYYLKDKST